MMASTQTSGEISGQAARCWALDQEADSALVPFGDRTTADAYVARQNAHQGRERWLLLDTQERIPDRPDATPALLPQDRGLSIGGFHLFDCAQALEVAAIVAHAAAGRRRIAGQSAGRTIATPVEDEVHLEIESGDGEMREWRFQRREARLLAARIATLAVHCLPLAQGEMQ